MRHIGPRRARRLIDGLGGDWRLWLDVAPARVFGTLRGIGPRQAAEAADSWDRRADDALRADTVDGAAEPSATGDRGRKPRR